MVLPGSWRHLLHGCDPDQVAAITSPAAPLLVVAAAGSGKTRVLTRRIAWRIAQEDALPRHVLALTFTRKAAGELRARLSSLGLPSSITAGTFHAVALAQLRRLALDKGRTPPQVLATKARLLAPLLEKALLGAGRAASARTPRDRQELVAILATEIEWAKSRLVGPSSYLAAARDARRAPPVELELVAEVFATYELERRRRHLLDFDDLLADLLRAIEEDPVFAAAQRWQFAHVFVDELQDATTLQLRLVDAWLGGRSDLFAVGDPRQSIYAFNGADPTAIKGFTQRYPGATVIELATNYRSSPQVLALASAALGPAGLPRGATAPRSGRPEGPVPQLTGFRTDRDEAAGVAAFLRRAHRPGRAWSAMAVLARTNRQLDILAEELAAAGIPTQRSGRGNVLLDLAVRTVLSQLPPDLDGARLSSFVAERASEATTAEACLETQAATERASALAVLVALCEDYLALDRAPSVAGFQAFVQASANEAGISRGDAVELTTFHRSKGLEWEVVCVTGLEDGLVPIAHAQSGASVEEERRLLYVALTRASDALLCTWAAERSFGARRVAREPSPWLCALDAARRQLAPGLRPEVVANGLAASRAALAAATAKRTKPQPRQKG